MLSPIWNEISETARRVKQRIKVVFDWAKASGYRSGDNPVEGVSSVLPKQNRKQDHYAALPYAELPVFIRKLHDYDGISSRLALEFLILCASRTGEVLKATWSEIDFDKKTWTIPADRMKAKEEHQVSLSARTIEILKAAQEISDGSNHVFPGLKEKHPLSNMSFNMLLRRMKYDQITVHGFRSTFRDWAEEKTHFPNSVGKQPLPTRSKIRSRPHISEPNCSTSV